MGGKWMRTHAKRVKQIMRDPLFEIGNHAWSHGNFGIMTPERMREEIQFTQAEYEATRSASSPSAKVHVTGLRGLIRRSCLCYSASRTGAAMTNL